MGQKSDRLKNIDQTGPAAEDQETTVRQNDADLPHDPDAGTVLDEILVVDENAVGVTAADGAAGDDANNTDDTDVVAMVDAAVDETDDTAEIRAGIEQTRSEISETINAIQERLDPGTLKEKIKDQVRESVHEQVQHAKDSVKEATVHKASDVLQGAKAAVQHAAETVRHAAGSALGAASSAAGSAMDAAEPAREATASKAGEVLHTAGEAVHAAHEATAHKAEEVAHKAGEVIHSAGAAVHTAREAIAGATRPAVETVSHVAHNAAQAAHSAAQTARGAASTMKQTSTSLVDTIKENPVPAAMVAIGLGWLAMQSSRSSSSSYDESHTFKAWSDGVEARGVDAGTNGTGRDYNGHGSGNGIAAHVGAVAGDTMDTAREAVGGAVDSARDSVSGAVGSARETVSGAVEGARETVGSAVEGARDTVGNLAGQTREHASHAAELVREQAYHSQDVFQQTLQQNPMAVGAVAVALGAAIGLALPGTRREQELMGETRDRLMQQTQAAAKDTFTKVQHVAEQVVGHVVEEVKTVADDAKTVAVVAAQEEGLTPASNGSNDASNEGSSGGSSM